MDVEFEEWIPQPYLRAKAQNLKSMCTARLKAVPFQIVRATSLIPRLAPSCHVDMLHAFDGTHVLRTFEGAGIGAAELAHAALHLLHRFVFVLFHPVAQFTLDVAQMIDAVAHQGGAQHRDVRADHEQFDDVLGAVDAAGRRQTGLHAAIQNADPGKRQPQRLRVLNRTFGRISSSSRSMSG